MMHQKYGHVTEKRDRLHEDVKDNICIIYVRSVSKKIRRRAATFGLRIAFNSRHNVENILCNVRPANDSFDLKNVIYSTPCECGLEYVGETGRRSLERINSVKSRPFE